VKRRNPDVARVYRRQNSGHKADARAMAQFGIFKAQVPDFAQHGGAIRVAVGIPTGGKGEHGIDRLKSRVADGKKIKPLSRHRFNDSTT